MSMEKWVDKDFRWNQKWFWLSFFFFLCLRLFWTNSFPMANDEVYYWDWSRALQLSYIDAPPLVAWCSSVGSIFFKGSFGARFLLPFLHAFSVLFLVGCTKLLCEYEGIKIKISHVICALILTETAPAFNLEGVILLPDGPLLLGISGALFFLLKPMTQSFIQKTGLSLKYAFLFGFFLGFSALAKYHAFPIAVGFFLAAVCFRGLKNLAKDFPFWCVVVATAVVVSSPVFIWNVQNNWASFRFQGQHGFAGMSLNIKAFARYCLGMIFYIWPWFFFAFIIFVVEHFTQKKEKLFSSVHNFTIFPFLILFFLILFSALGKQALPHWALPGFFLLIPSFVTQWNPFQKIGAKTKMQSLWKIFISTSFLFSITLPTLGSFKKFNHFIVDTFVYFKGNADPLAQVFQWENLQNEITKQQTISIQSLPYVTSLSQHQCRSPYEIASLRWYWTAQVAFHFQNQPKVYNFDLNNSSFYTWRDSLHQLSGCRFVVIGSKDQFNARELSEFMDIENTQEFSLMPYPGNKIIFIKGTLKNIDQLKKLGERLKENIRY